MKKIVNLYQLHWLLMQLYYRLMLQRGLLPMEWQRNPVHRIAIHMLHLKPLTGMILFVGLDTIR